MVIKIHEENFFGESFKIGYRVVTSDLKSLGLVLGMPTWMVKNL